jgi:hypothetical protein
VTRDAESGLSLLDVLVGLALLALFVWLLRMDWAGHRRPRGEPPPTAIAAACARHTLTHSSVMFAPRSSSSIVARLYSRS